jgi:hypothetical protein
MTPTEATAFRLWPPSVPFLGTKEIPEAHIYPRLSVNCFNHVFINAGEGIATALPHGERIAASNPGQAAFGLFTVSILSRILPRSRFAI